MDYNPDDIINLTLEEIAGVITVEDKQYLYQVIADHREAFLCWQELHASVGEQQLREAEESIAGIAIADVIRIGQRRRRAFIYKRISIAVSAFLLITASFYFYTPNRHVTHRSDNIVATAFFKKYPWMELESGEIISLPDSVQTIQHQSITFINKNHTLNFTDNGQKPQLATLYVPAGQDYKMTLPDGSEIQINSSTAVEFRTNFTGKNREIYVNGEAYLQVAPNDKKPFKVELPGGTRTNVLGTAFNINTYDRHNMRVALVTGSVNVQSDKVTVSLQALKTVSIKTGKISQPTDFDSLQVLSWRTGVYQQEDPISLKEVLTIAQRWYGVRVQIDDSTHLQLRYGGTMDRHQPIDILMKNIKGIHKAFSYYYDHANTLHIK